MAVAVSIFFWPARQAVPENDTEDAEGKIELPWVEAGTT
jgi:hypothetical protein